MRIKTKEELLAMPGVVENIYQKEIHNPEWTESSVCIIYSDMYNYLGKSIPENSEVVRDGHGSDTFAHGYYWADWMLTEEELTE